ncbi:MAG: hypothetical protein IKV28_04860 [Bacteroidales bacterium]|nr:hypothetical protein [Bacteroidales bacterium]
MKQIKLSVLLVAVLAFFTSCQEKDFTPVTGNTQVEFVNPTTEVVLSGEYLYIPLQMIEQSNKAAKVKVAFDGGTIVTNEDLEVTVFEDEHIIITSTELYIGAYDEDVDGEGLPTNSIEVRVPKFREYKSISLRFSIVSDNAGQYASTVFTANAPEKGEVAGQYELASSFDGSAVVVTIFAVDGDPTAYTLMGLVGGQDTEPGFTATYSEPTLTVSNAANTAVNYNGIDIIACPFDGSYLYPDNQITWTITTLGFTSDNGIFCGFNDGSWKYFFVAMPGDEAARL